MLNCSLERSARHAILDISSRVGPLNRWVVPLERLAPYLAEADALIGAIDPNDVPFVAVALAEEHEGIWSNNHAFERLPGIPCWTTTRLKIHLGF